MTGTFGSDGLRERAWQYALHEFLSRLHEDRQNGVEHPLSWYQDLFPKFRAEIAQEFARLEARADELPSQEDVPEKIDRFDVIERLGRGGQGVVYRAWDPQLQHEVALKILRLDRAGSSAQTRLCQEALTFAQLQYPGICHIHELIYTDAGPCLVMQLLKGRALLELIAESRNPTRVAGTGLIGTAVAPGATDADAITRSLAFVQRCAEILHRAHDSGVLHRDIKPANIFVTPDGPVFVDFGLAHRAERPNESSCSGTLPYMAPEQIHGSEPDGPWTDVWALAVTLHELLTLGRPFSSSNFDLEDAIVREPPVFGDIGGRPLPRDVRKLLLHAFEKATQARCQSAKEFADTLDRIVRKRRIRARLRQPGVLATIAAPIAFAGVVSWFAWQRHVEEVGTYREKAVASAQEEWRLVLRSAFESLGEQSDRCNAVQSEPPETRERRLALVDKYIVTLDESDPRHHVAVALRALVASDNVGALAALDSVAATQLDRHSASPRIDGLRIRMIALHRLRRHDDALAACDELLKLEKDASDAWNARGLNLSAIGKKQEALAAFTAAIECRPASAFPLANRGAVYGHLRQWDAAAADFRSALDLWPDSTLYLFNLAACEQNRGNLDASLALYDRVIAADPGCANAYAGRARTRAMLSGDRASIPDYERAYELGDRDNSTLSNFAQALMAIGQSERALPIIDLLPRMGPLASETSKIRGDALWKLGRLADSVESFSTAIAFDPGEPYFWRRRARGRYELGDLDGALADVNESMRCGGKSSLALFLRSLIWDKKGEPQRELEDLESCLRMGLDAPEVSWNYAVTLATLGRTREACASVQRVIIESPDDPSPIRYLAKLLMTLRDFNSALGILDVALEVETAPSAESLVPRAECLIELGRIDEAIQDLVRVAEISKDKDERTRMLSRIDALRAQQPPK